MKKILVVDDSAVIRQTLAHSLKASEFEVFTAADGSEAVSSVRKSRPDLILLDIGFPPQTDGPPWDGFAIIQWLRRMEEAKNIPIIIISGAEAAKYKDRALAQGVQGYFQKPINNDELVAAIRSALNGSAAPVN
jgi:DNA-binding response OmpR family regulator